ncbi:MAG: Abi family protein [Tannerellaceae bacterium]|jgi:abortive infection bacteriophage resistance protein|nr:Abi family protein [Tannerellaceae bacterium]
MKKGKTRSCDKKKATTIEQQIDIFKQRGMILDEGEEKAKEALSDIGYFRLGFYCCPFEKKPHSSFRDHIYQEGTKLSDILHLYYLDVDLRMVLLKYMYYIEVNFRTKVSYITSIHYVDNSRWFVDPSIMEQEYAYTFYEKVYSDFKKKSILKKHHAKYPDDKYAPAWKTLEFMTFGSILTLMKNIRDDGLKSEISQIYGIKSVSILFFCIESIVYIRNLCAHGGVLFDSQLPNRIKNKGPASLVNTVKEKTNLYAAIQIILFILGKIAAEKAICMQKEVEGLLCEYSEREAIRAIIETRMGYSLTSIKKQCLCVE